MVTIGLLAVDLQHGENVIQWQTNSMFRVVGVENINYGEAIEVLRPTGLFPELFDPLDVCRWNGVECAEERLRNVTWRTGGDYPVHLRNLHIRWFPSTLRRISIQNQQLHDEACLTRFFPCDSRIITIRSSRLTGSLDMKSLPVHLEGLDLQNNELTGTVVLVRLPRSLVYINLQLNPILLILIDQNSLRISGKIVDSKVSIKNVSKKHMGKKKTK